MKKILLFTAYFLAGVFSIQAQILYGTTSEGGPNGGGTINKYSVATNQFTVAFGFENFIGAQHLTKASNGKLYGTTGQSGGHGVGYIFSYDPSDNAYKKLWDFDSTSGSLRADGPSGGLLQANDGKLYGVTSRGGAYNAGVIFSFDPITNEYNKLHDFDAINGGSAYSILIQATDSKIYGTATGGNPGFGVIFSFDPLTATYTKLKDFTGTDGAEPNGLLQGNDGKLYGTTAFGGLNDRGVIFSFDPILQIFAKLYDLSNINGVIARSSLLQAGNGKLYGTTAYGGLYDFGVIFSFDPITSIYSKLKDFSVASGTQPSGSLISVNNGVLYGLTFRGGSNDKGVIFSFNTLTNVYYRLYNFDGINSPNPYGDLALANNGKLFGMTNGSNSDRGIIFSFDPGNQDYTIAKKLNENSTGSSPVDNPVYANNGKLYGVTPKGGSHGLGALYSFDPAASIFTILFDFDSLNGASPYSSPTQASNGKLYGMTFRGGTHDLGIIYTFDPVTGIFRKLLDFNAENGSGPTGHFTEASNGKLYGATSFGGINDLGVIFALNPLDDTYVKLKDLDLASGTHPSGNLLLAKDGKLYGTAVGSSYQFGAIFSIDPISLAYQKLAELYVNDGSIGAFLIQGADGLIYGSSQGYLDPGGMFSFNPVTLLFGRSGNFDFTKVAAPHGLLLASDGKYYGLGFEGAGENFEEPGNGAVFSFDPSASQITSLIPLTWETGWSPISSFVEITDCAAPTNWYQDADRDGYGNLNKSIKACTQPTGYVADSTDCDDTNKNVHTGATYYRDADGDGYGNSCISQQACTPPNGYVTNHNDCNDNDKAVHSAVKYYRDADHDGFGDAGVYTTACSSTAPAGYVKNNYDCDDHKRSAHHWHEKVIMCHNGTSDCVPVWDIFRRLCLGWKLGPCAADCNTPAVSSAIAPGIETGDAENDGAGKTSIPRQYSLTNYPNPFAGTSTIRYGLPYDSKVSVKVYDVLGRTVATLVSENKKAGNYTVNFNARKITSGPLYYRIIAVSKDHQFHQTNKMILIK